MAIPVSMDQSARSMIMVPNRLSACYRFLERWVHTLSREAVSFTVFPQGIVAGPSLPDLDPAFRPRIACIPREPCFILNAPQKANLPV